MNLCTVCGEDFGSVGAFEAHRVGAHMYTFSAEHPDGRRCLTTEELLRNGWRRDGSGRWRRPNVGTAPWSQSHDHVTTQSRAKQLPTLPTHLRSARPSTRSRKSQKQER